MTEEEARNNAMTKSTVREPTTKEEAKALIAKLKDIEGSIGFIIEEQRLDKVGKDSKIFVVERQGGEKAHWELYNKRRSIKVGINTYKSNKEQINNIIKELEQRWGLEGIEIEAQEPWTKFNNNNNNTADLTYSELYRYIENKKGSKNNSITNESEQR